MATRTAGIIGEDCTVTVAFGNSQVTSDSPGTFPTADAITCFVRSARFSTSVGTVDVSALCDTTAKMQVTKASGTLELEVYADSALGYYFSGKEGYFVQVVITPNGLTSELKTFTGVITAHGINVANSEAVTENVTITLGANGVTSAWA